METEIQISKQKINGKYILDPKTREVIPEPDLMKWAAWFEKADRRVAKNRFRGNWICTVFIGLDLRYYGGNLSAPLVFETVIFSKRKKIDGLMNRYASEEEARAGHMEMLIKANGGRVPRQWRRKKQNKSR